MAIQWCLYIRILCNGFSWSNKIKSFVIVTLFVTTSTYSFWFFTVLYWTGLFCSVLSLWKSPTPPPDQDVCTWSMHSVMHASPNLGVPCTLLLITTEVCMVKTNFTAEKYILNPFPWYRYHWGCIHLYVYACNFKTNKKLPK